MNPSFLALFITPALLAQTPPAADWRAAESPGLTRHVQLTFPDTFSRAGEAYFSPDSNWIIFQAVERPAADADAPADSAPPATPAPIYAMYVAKIIHDDTGFPKGIEDPIQISPEGSANTCGYFHPKAPARVIFGSTLVPPGSTAAAGYQRGTSTYAWQFPTEMDVVTRVVPTVAAALGVDYAEADLVCRPFWKRDGYDAECAYSPDGRHIIYTRVDTETLDPDLYVFDTKTNLHRPVIVAPGYDGGPFFSPDGSMICYRSDRQGNDLLQIHIAQLAFDENGAILGAKLERAVTANEHVNWAPFWHTSGEYLLYTTSEQGHRNYEVYSTQVPIGILADVRPQDLKRRRITNAAGFDGLPVFNSTGTLMMWTSQRGPQLPSEERPSSQLWIAATNDLSPDAAPRK